MIAPRHLVRSNKLFDELTKIIPAQFITRRSKNEPITEQTKIYFSDTMGDITLIASLSDILFMGNSLSVKGGGHNPIEPASIGTGIITGHKLKNFTEIYNIFRQENSCIFADNPDDLIRKIIILKNNAYLLSQITEKSYNLCKKYRQSALLPINDISQLIHHLQHR
jgi:3-deoxy-D-manno-octulosonic-acid transferase